MKAHPRVLTGLIVLATAVLAAVAATVATAAGPSINAAAQAGTVWQRGLQNAAGHAKHTTSPTLTYHGGPVMTTPTEVFPIFWGTSWSSDTSGERSGIDLFYSNVGGTGYAGTNGEYNDSTGGVVSTVVHNHGSVIDSTAAISHAPQTSDILAEVQRVYGSNLTANAYYPVYVDQPRGHAQYCAWHSTGTINGVRVQFAFFFKLDGDPGCAPDSPGNQSPGLAALGNVSGHELSEMLTDPQLNAWYDSQGAENADKCAWTFGTKLLSLGKAGDWRIQGNWSNDAYNAGRGYTDSGSKVVGCIDGTNA